MQTIFSCRHFTQTGLALGAAWPRRLPPTPACPWWWKRRTTGSPSSKQGGKAVLWHYTNNYFTWPLLAARVDSAAIFLLAQRWIIPGLAAGAVKG